METGKRVRNFIPPAPSSCVPATFKGGPLYTILPYPSGSRGGNSSVLLALVQSLLFGASQQPAHTFVNNPFIHPL